MAEFADSNAFLVTIDAAGGISFDGPNIINQTGVENEVFVFDGDGAGDVSARFTGAVVYALAPTSDPLPAGMSINSTTGNPEGTPTVNGTFGNIIIEGSDTPAYSPEVQAVLDRMTALTAGEISAIEAFVDGLVADGIWAKLDEFWCFALNGTDWLTGWKSATASVVGSITRDSNGARCNDDSSHINTTLDLSTLTQYQATDAGIGAFVHSWPSDTTFFRDMFGVSDGTNITRWRHNGNDTNDVEARLNTSAAVTVSQTLPVSSDLISMDDDGANALTSIDATQQGTTASVGTIPAGQNLILFRYNSNGTPDRPSVTNAIITDFYVGAKINLTQFQTRLLALHTALGVT